MYCQGVYVRNLERTVTDRKQPKPTNFCAYLFTSQTFLTINYYKHFNYYILTAQNGPDDGLNSQKL